MKISFLTKSKTTNTPKIQKVQIPENHISKKKKNTYVIAFNVMAEPTLFGLCNSTPLPVIEINGIKQTSDSGFINGKQFPNPNAINFIHSHDILREIMGERISATIIEYLDKDTGKPVVQVYPEGWYVFDNYGPDYMTHLNHASRCDLKHQLKIRDNMINEYIARQQVR
jgi:hypothetical protein